MCVSLDVCASVDVSVRLQPRRELASGGGGLCLGKSLEGEEELPDLTHADL